MRASFESRGTEAATPDTESSTGVSTDVVVAIAEREGVDPVDLDDRLHDWIDPDALDAVVATMNHGHVTFEVADHRVRVRSNGRVLVDE